MIADERLIKMIEETHRAVIGEEKTGHEGLVKMCQRHDKWIRSADLRVMFILGGAAVVGLIIKFFI